MDGNGRIGRLLITLLLCSEGTLSGPLLYLSLYFKQNRSEYYDRLQAVRTDGDWEGWLDFFFRGLRDTAQAAVTTVEAVLDLFRCDRERLQTLGRAAGSAMRVHELLQRQPILSLPAVAEDLELSWTAVDNAMRELTRLCIVREITGQKRNRLYAYDAYLEMLAEGTEPLD
jgi:Fic family protein